MVSTGELEAGIAERVALLADLLLASCPGRIYREVLAGAERALLARVLERTRGNQLHAARLLGLNRNTLRERCRKAGLALPGQARGGRPAGPHAPAPAASRA